MPLRFERCVHQESKPPDHLPGLRYPSCWGVTFNILTSSSTHACPVFILPLRFPSPSTTKALLQTVLSHVTKVVFFWAALQKVIVSVLSTTSKCDLTRRGKIKRDVKNGHCGLVSTVKATLSRCERSGEKERMNHEAGNHKERKQRMARLILYVAKQWRGERERERGTASSDGNINE